ncbi:hypothetical protein [Streptomyces sp. NPDC091217]|uniref:hypothetical protein n=2 Tax=unclassified Streptomyces TaxID=2593676 RepID=UPI00382AE3D0
MRDVLAAAAIHLVPPSRARRRKEGGVSLMRALSARRLGVAFAAGVLMAGGAATGAAGTAAAAAPAVHTQVPTDSCFGHDDWRCFGNGGFRFGNPGFGFGQPGFCFNHSGFCFDHRFDHGFDHGFGPGFEHGFGHRFDHRFVNGSIVIILLR